MTHDSILTILSERGYRITQARSEIVSALEEAKKPQTIQEFVQAVNVDEVTVYRTITLLVHESLIEEIPLQGGPTHYALAHEHHHHAVCTTCNRIEHLPCTLQHHTPPTIRGFSDVDRHEVTYYGTCTSCART